MFNYLERWTKMVVTCNTVSTSFYAATHCEHFQILKSSWLLY